MYSNVLYQSSHIKFDHFGVQIQFLGEHNFDKL